MAKGGGAQRGGRIRRALRAVGRAARRVGARLGLNRAARRIGATLGGGRGGRRRGPAGRRR